MSDIITTTHDEGPRDSYYWAARISGHWQLATASIIQCGIDLIEAKDDLDHGEFTAMVERRLPFTPRTAQMLMKIANHPVIANPNHGSLLPPSWRTLSELALLPPKVVEAKIADGTINPKMERKDVAKLTKKPGDAKAKHKARITPIVELKQEKEELERENADLQEQLANAEAGAAPFDLVDDEVESIADTIIRIAGADKAQQIAAAILQRFKRPPGRPKALRPSHGTKP